MSDADSNSEAEADATATRASNADEISDEQLLEFYDDVIDVWQAMGRLGDDAAETLIVPGTAKENYRAWYYYDQQGEHIELPDEYDVDGNDQLSAARAWSPHADADEIPHEIFSWHHRLPH
jgi:hypothetical protein